MSELSGKRVVVVGLGASGVAAARLCLRRGAPRRRPTTASPARPSPPTARALEGARRGRSSPAGTPSAAHGRGRPGRRLARRARLCPRSTAAERRGVPVWGEVELAVRSMTHPAPRRRRSAARTARAPRPPSSARCSRRSGRRDLRRAATWASRSRAAPTSASTSSSSRCRASRWSASIAFGPTSVRCST